MRAIAVVVGMIWMMASIRADAASITGANSGFASVQNATVSIGGDAPLITAHITSAVAGRVLVVHAMIVDNQFGGSGQLYTFYPLVNGVGLEPSSIAFVYSPLPSGVATGSGTWWIDLAPFVGSPLDITLMAAVSSTGLGHKVDASISAIQQVK